MIERTVPGVAETPVTLDLSGVDAGTRPHQVLADGPCEPPAKSLGRLELNGWGYRWIRLRRGARA